jgi:hypothetical protein
MSKETAMSASSTAEKMPAQKTKVEKAQSYLTVISTTIGIIGAVGAGFAWVATTFFLGDVQIRPDKPVQTVCVKITDKHGQTAFYYGKDVQLMPGNYHLEIGLPDKAPTQHADVNVQLWKIAVIPWAVPADAAAATAITTDETNDTSSPDHKRWWQFWKKSAAPAGQTQ